MTSYIAAVEKMIDEQASAAELRNALQNLVQHVENIPGVGNDSCPDCEPRGTDMPCPYHQAKRLLAQFDR